MLTVPAVAVTSWILELILSVRTLDASNRVLPLFSTFTSQLTVHAASSQDRPVRVLSTVAFGSGFA